MENAFLEDKLLAYASSDAYAFHMPGHKRVWRDVLTNPCVLGHKVSCEDLAEEGGDGQGSLRCASPYAFDITEIDGFDNLHDPEGILAGEMAFAARLYGTKRTHFLVGGSTLGILVAISAAVPRGGHILIERGCHISVYHAAELRQLRVSYMEDPWQPPDPDKPGQWAVGVGTPQEIDRGADEAKGVVGDGADRGADEAKGVVAGRHYDAIVLTSPTYEGAVRPVAKWAAFARKTGAVLIVDEAHGVHLPFCSGFPKSGMAEGVHLPYRSWFPNSAIAEGADLVVQSLHKTLPALTQTALLHEVTGRVSERRIRKFLDIYETSSPSYLLLSSITATLHGLAQACRGCTEHASDGEHLAGGACLWRCAKRHAAMPASCGLSGEGDGGGKPKIVRKPGVLGESGFGEGTIEHYLRLLWVLRQRLSGLSHFSLLGGVEAVSKKGEFPGIPQGARLDPGKIVLLCRGGLSGPALYERLRLTYHLQPEMRGPDYVLCMTSFADTAEGFERLAAAMEEIDREALALAAEEKDGGMERKKPVQANGLPLPPVACPIFEAAEAEWESVPLAEATGRVSAGFVLLYPPDTPLLVPGEVFTEAIVRRIEELHRGGFAVLGIDEKNQVMICRF